jgi:hypothetical protein
MKLSRFGLVALAMGVALVHLTCHQALFTAPPDTTIVLIANPTFIPANTGISVITGVLTESTGTPVADGTVLQCFTNLGRVDPEGRTNDGVAKVNLYADSRSGTATVQCLSGGAASGGTPTTTTTQPPSSLTAGSFREASLAGSKAVSAVSANSDKIDVIIGSANPQSMFVTANPQRITTPRFTTIAANVFGADGNPVSNVPVFFTIDLPTDGTTLQETLDSGGSPRYTDNNGRATDILRTSYDPAEKSKTVSVTASIPGDPAAPKSVTVIVN